MSSKKLSQFNPKASAFVPKFAATPAPAAAVANPTSTPAPTTAAATPASPAPAASPASKSTLKTSAAPFVPKLRSDAPAFVPSFTKPAVSTQVPTTVKPSQPAAPTATNQPLAPAPTQKSTAASAPAPSSSPASTPAASSPVPTPAPVATATPARPAPVQVPASAPTATTAKPTAPVPAPVPVSAPAPAEEKKADPAPQEEDEEDYEDEDGEDYEDEGEYDPDEEALWQKIEEMKQKRRYDRDALLKLREVVRDSGEKPAGLPDLKDLINKGYGAGGAGPRRTGPPRPARPQDGRGGRGGKRGGRGRGGRGGRHEGPRVELTGPVKDLERTDAGYTIKRNVPPDEALKRNITQILNKLTPEKFDTLVTRVIELKIESIDQLRDVVTAVFDKAVAEPNFSPTYAEFCSKLNEKMPKFIGDDKKEFNFRKGILNQCQEEFESFDSSVDDVENKDLTEEQKEEKNNKMRKRQLGTIRFIGELFGRSLLAAKIVCTCLSILLGDVNQPSEEQLELLCRLLGTVGKNLEAKEKLFVDEFFVRLTPLGSSPNLTSRFRFMIQDTVELRKNAWVPRLKQGEAKKLADIKKEDEEEKRRAEAAAASPVGRGKRGGGGGGAGPARGGGRGAPPARKQDRYSGFGGSQGQDDRRSAKGGAPGGPGGPGGRGGGRGGAPAASGRQAPAKQDAPLSRANAFDALGDEEEEGNESPVKAGSKPTTPIPAAVNLEAKDFKEVPRLSPEQCEKKIDALLGELKVSGDFKEAVTCVEELGSTDNNEKVYNRIMAKVYEGNDKLCNTYAKLVFELAAKKLLTEEHFNKGLVPDFEILEDLLIDSPKAPEFLAEIVGASIAGGASSFAFLLSDALRSMDSKLKPQFAANVVAAVNKYKGEATAAMLNGVKLSSFAAKEALAKLLTDKNLQSLIPALQ